MSQPTHRQKPADHLPHAILSLAAAVSLATIPQLLLATIPQLLWATSLSAQSSARPNIVLIMADDLGFECIGANGGTSYRTPVLDQLASEGVRFEHCYSQPICTPSRVKLMTGIYNVSQLCRVRAARDDSEDVRQPAPRQRLLDMHRRKVAAREKQNAARSFWI